MGKRALTAALVTAVAGAGTLAGTAAAHDAAGHAAGQGDARIEVPGIGLARQAADGLLEVQLADGTVLTTHGMDTAADTEGHEANSGGFVRGPAREPACGNDHHQHVLYARPVGAPDRLDEVRSDILSDIDVVNGALNEAARESGGGTADFKVRCTSAGAIDIGSFVSQGSTFSDIVSSARAAGFNRSRVNYTIFYDGDGGCGVASATPDDRATHDNAHNAGGAYAVNYRRCWIPHTVLHEVAHNQGAVLYYAPYSTGSGHHCRDEWDVMCYSDGGDRDLGTFERCGGIERFDCGYDTYFDAAPEPGEWLASHWNLGSRLNRFIAFGAAGAPEPGRATGPSVDAGPDHTTVYPFEHNHSGATATDANRDLSRFRWTCEPRVGYGECPEGADFSGTLRAGASSLPVPGPTLHILPGFSVEITLSVWDEAGRVASDSMIERAT